MPMGPGIDSSCGRSSKEMQVYKYAILCSRKLKIWHTCFAQSENLLNLEMCCAFSESRDGAGNLEIA